MKTELFGNSKIKLRKRLGTISVLLQSLIIVKNKQKNERQYKQPLEKNYW